MFKTKSAHTFFGKAKPKEVPMFDPDAEPDPADPNEASEGESAPMATAPPQDVQPPVLPPTASPQGLPPAPQMIRPNAVKKRFFPTREQKVRIGKMIKAAVK